MLGIPLQKGDVRPYRYFDTPDGEDIFKKLWVVLKPTTAAAIGVSTADVLLYSHPEGYLKIIGRYVKIGGPMLAIASTFVITTNLSANIRKKDDKLNWFLGGASSGAVLGAAARSTVLGVCAAGFLGMAGLLKKYAAQNDFVLIPTKRKQAEGGAWAAKHDWSLIEHRPGNWTK